MTEALALQGGSSGGAPTAHSTAAALDRVVDELEAICARNAFELAYKAGELLMATLYRGSLEHFRSSGRKHPTYQALLSHPRLHLSPTAVWRSLRLYELCQRLPWVLESPQINVTHVYAVIGLPQSTQEDLLRQTQREGWVAGQLEAEAKQFRRAGGRGRPRLSALDASIRSLQKVLAHPFRQVRADTVADEDSSKVAAMRRLLKSVVERCLELDLVLSDTREK